MKMKVKIIADRRDVILDVLEHKLGVGRVYHPLPDFSYSVAGYTVERSGYIVSDEDNPEVFTLLASLGLCEGSFNEVSPDDASIHYFYDNNRVRTLINLFCIISARSQLINKAIGARGAFSVAKPLMNSILKHPPLNSFEFLQLLYGRENEYRGIYVSHSYVSFCGFAKAPAAEAFMHRQLADCIMDTALSRQWIKPFTKRSKDQRSVMRNWLNAIGMGGPEHELARRTMLARFNNNQDAKTCR